jgi:hypothetical protein
MHAVNGFLSFSVKEGYECMTNSSKKKVLRLLCAFSGVLETGRFVFWGWSFGNKEILLSI